MPACVEGKSHCPAVGTAPIIFGPCPSSKYATCRSRTASIRSRKASGRRLRGLFNRQYRDVHAVRGIDLDVEQGEFVAFLGPNGAGKTTTLKLLSGVINPTAGEARVMGHVPWKRENSYRRRFALVMGQKNQLWWDLPAAESFRLHQQIYCIDPVSFKRTHDELVDLLDVRRLLNQPVRELSLGERMKMELIAALLHSPDVLFLDEPTIGLDVIAQHNIQKFLKHYQEVAANHDPAHEPLHERRGRALQARRGHQPRPDHVRRLARRESSINSAATRCCRCNLATARCPAT